jgi:hypothetical protein
MTKRFRHWAVAALLAAGVSGGGRLALADLLGYWDFNATNTPAPSLTLDQSGKNNHGTIQGGAVYTADKGGYTGKAGDRGLTLDGTNDSVFLQSATFGAFDSIPAKNQLTVSYWMYGSDDQPLNQSTFWAEPDRSFQAHAPWGDGNVYFDTGGCICDAKDRLSGESDPATLSGAWSHWVFVKNGSEKYVYVDGVELLSSTEATAPMNGPLTGLWLGSGNGGNFSKGDYDDFAIWDEALTPTQVETLFNSGVRAVETNLPTVSTYTPPVPAGRLALGANNALVGAAYVADAGTGAPVAHDAKWSVSQVVSKTLVAPDTDYQPGLAVEWFDGPNWNTSAIWSAATPAPGQYTNSASFPDFPAFRVPTVSYGWNKLDSGLTAAPEYPAQTGWVGNHENYSARFSGEIFIPAAGTYTFRDHNDDYAFLSVDGEVLIDDNTATGWDSAAAGGAVGTKTFAASGWYSIDFRGAEGGGGDNFRLLWDYAGEKQDNADGESTGYPGFNTVDEDFFRSKLPGVSYEFLVPLGTIAKDLSVGAAGQTSVGDQVANVPLGFTLGAGQTYNLRLTVADGQGLVGGSTVINTTLTGVGGGDGGLPGDVNGDKKVDLTDFGILKENFGKSAAADVAVPEPSTCLLAVLGLVGLVATLRKRR